MLTRRSMILSCLAVAACTAQPEPEPVRIDPPLYPNETPELRAILNKWADHYELPRRLVHRLAIRESTHRPWARNGPYWGLFQILPATARTMGFSGRNEDLLDADTNAKYALKYLRGAYLVAKGNEDAAIMWYAKGYYYEAKRQGLLVETGLRPG
ncbi:transglycosylase SLT domain-containing protein [Tropicibacter alexandrii]|uniref:transglycosylase SLT domain-containing protein n=1 Tax=Tropicibacter alexandrii TaxID=2267683 RepID=UPI001981CB74|nr:lytic transglycosylase domain-containing protein [Tropicibacter alexandrii]